MKILAVDDSKSWIQAHITLLNKIFNEDVEIVTANSAFNGLEEYKNNKFDLVITDLQMENDYEPLYAGEWLVKEIQQINKLQKIIIISSCYNISQIADTYSVDYLSKRNIVYDEKVYENKIKNII